MERAVSSQTCRIFFQEKKISSKFQNKEIWLFSLMLENSKRHKVMWLDGFGNLPNPQILDFSSKFEGNFDKNYWSSRNGAL